jgi:dienelactone hydrolase
VGLETGNREIALNSPECGKMAEKCVYPRNSNDRDFVPKMTDFTIVVKGELRMSSTGFLVLALALPFAALAQVKTDVIEYEQGGAKLQGYVSYETSASGRRPGVVILPDWMGVSDNMKNHAEKLAAEGYVVVTADIYGKGIRPKNAEEARAQSGKYYGDRPLYRARAKAALDLLSARSDVDPARLGVMGYCFGGAGAVELARTGAPLKGVVTFHGSLPTSTAAESKNIRGSILVLHGADDPYVKQEAVRAFQDEMKEAGVDTQIHYYSGAVHSFTDRNAGSDNSKGAAYNERADKRSWEAMSDFFRETLGK